MTLAEHYSKNISLAFPVMLSQMGHVLVSMADSMMVGRLGATPLASVSLANSTFMVIMLFGIGVSHGVTPLVAASDGASDKKQVAILLKHGILLNLIIGLVLVGMAELAGQSLYYMNQDADVLKGAIPYFRILTFSLLPLLIFQSFRQFAEGLSLTKQSMYISISANLVNILFNYFLIFGKFGFPELGIQGAGWSTFISRVVMALTMGLFVFSYPKLKVYVASFRSTIIHWQEMRKILKIGVPTGLQYIFEIGAFSMATIMVGWIGVVELAAHQIALNLSALTYMTASGIAAAASVRTANQFGRKDYKTLRMAGMTCFVMVIGLMTFFGISFILGKSYFPTWYIDDNAVIQMAASLLVIASIFQVSDGVQVVGLGALRGIADVKAPTLFTLVAYWVLALPMSYLLGIYFELGAVGLWIGLLIGLSTSAIANFGRFHALSRRLIRMNSI